MRTCVHVFIFVAYVCMCARKVDAANQLLTCQPKRVGLAWNTTIIVFIQQQQRVGRGDTLCSARCDLYPNQNKESWLTRFLLIVPLTEERTTDR